eukprot:Em0004g1621a
MEVKQLKQCLILAYKSTIHEEYSFSHDPVLCNATSCIMDVISRAFGIHEALLLGLALYRNHKIAISSSSFFTCKRDGRHEKLQPIDFLCNLWANNDLTCLWNLAKGRANKLRDAPVKNLNTPGKPVDMAVSFDRCGMLGKACQTLLSSGIAPNNDTTWQLLKAKNPAAEIPIIPSVHSGSISLDSSFEIGAVLRSFPKVTAAGPSGLCIQHLLDVISVPLTSSLRDVVNLLVSGKTPQAVSKFMAGGRLIALNKNKEGSPPDIRPIVVGESLRRLAGKCICASLKEKISSFFQPLHFGVACRAGAEKIVHSLQNCIEEHWMQEEDFVIFKVDMTNAFNLISRQACYGSHPELWHPMGHLCSQSGVQQGDPLGPMLFALVLQKLISTIDADDECLQLLLQAWYLDDDGVLAGFGSASNRHLLSAILKFNAITVESVLSSPLSQHVLCKKLDDHLFQSNLMTSSPANKARLLSASAPHASSWLSVVPSLGLGLHLDPAEFQIKVMWWLGMNSSIQSVCPFCPNITLDPLGHHAVSCRHGGDVVIRHNRLLNIFAEFCRRAHLSVRVEVGQGLSRVQINSRPADVLVDAWDRAKPAAFDVVVTSPLTPATLHDACNSAGVAAHKAECRKHSSNYPKCQELGWLCVPLAVESYGNWGKEAQNTFARLASILSISLHCPKAKVLTEIYGRLNISLVDPGRRKVASAISLAQDGLFGKACQVLTSSGVAPNNDDTWNLLITGPSGLRIQHLIDAAEVPLQTPLLHTLRAVINLLIFGSAPLDVAIFLAGGCLTSESGVQQGDPLGPLLFSLVLNILVMKVARDSACSNLPFHAWYLDDGVIAGPRSSLCRILSLLQEEGPALGIIVNLPKCEAFSRHGLDMFPLRMKKSDKPSLEILGIPIGNQEFCSSFISKKHTKAKILLSLLEESSHHLSQAIETFNSLVSPADAVSVESLLTSSVSQKYLSVVPSENLGLHLDPPVFQVAIKWWLGLDTSKGSQCALCPGSTLDHLGHHAVTCKYGGDVVSRHNRIRDILVETCRRAHIGVKVEVGNNLSRDHSKTRPADILLPNWFLGRTAALDVSITSPLNPVTLLEAGVSATAAAQATEARKHQANDPKCSELGWVCVPMVVETYGAWGKEATAIIFSVASRLATSTCRPKSTILHEIYVG